MKFFTIFLVITLFIIDGVQNAPAIHPIHVQTIPLHPVTARSTPRKPIISTIRPSQHSNMISSSLSSTTTYDPSSGWYHRYSTAECVIGILLLVIVSVGLAAALRSLCKSEKQQKSRKKTNSHVVKNKMYVSTINGTREEPPPAYAEIHHV